jgi:hypothetical protein
MMDQCVLYVPGILSLCATAALTHCLKPKHNLFLIQIMFECFYCCTEYGEGTGFERHICHSKMRIKHLAVTVVTKIRSTMEIHAL